MDANIIPGSRLHSLIQQVLPPTLPTIEAPSQPPQPRDVVDVSLRGPASAAPTSAPVDPVPTAPAPAPAGFVPFATQAPGAEAPTAPVNNPTVLTMEEPAGQPLAVDERKSPVDQAKDLNVLLLGRIMDVSKRSSALSSAEVGEHLALLGWASDKLESLSQQLEGQGKKKENEYVESIQRDLDQATQTFAQIHQGSVATEQGAQYYRTAAANEIGQSVMQTNLMNSQRRAGVIGYYTSMRSGMQAGVGGPMPGMMPGQMPGMMPGQMPGMMPGQMMPGQVPGMMPGQMMPGGPMLNIGGPVVGPGSPGYGMPATGYPQPGQPGYSPAGVPPYPGTWYGR